MSAAVKALRAKVFNLNDQIERMRARRNVTIAIAIGGAAVFSFFYFIYAPISYKDPSESVPRLQQKVKELQEEMWELRDNRIKWINAYDSLQKDHEEALWSLKVVSEELRRMKVEKMFSGEDGNES